MRLSRTMCDCCYNHYLQTLIKKTNKGLAVLGDAFNRVCCWPESLLSTPSSLALLPSCPWSCCETPPVSLGPAQAALPSCTRVGTSLHARVRLDGPDLSSAANWGWVKSTRRVEVAHGPPQRHQTYRRTCFNMQKRIDHRSSKLWRGWETEGELLASYSGLSLRREHLGETFCFVPGVEEVPNRWKSAARRTWVHSACHASADLFRFK